MSVVKALGEIKYWIGAGSTLLIGVIVNAIGAAMVVGGVIAPEKAWYIQCAGWFLGVFCASRLAARGEKGALLPGLAVLCISFGAACLLGLILSSGHLVPQWWISGAAALAGAVGSSVMRPGEKRRRSRGRKVTMRKKLR